MTGVADMDAAPSRFWVVSSCVCRRPPSDSSIGGDVVHPEMRPRVGGNRGTGSSHSGASAVLVWPRGRRSADLVFAVGPSWPENRISVVEHRNRASVAPRCPGRQWCPSSHRANGRRLARGAGG